MMVSQYDRQSGDAVTFESETGSTRLRALGPETRKRMRNSQTPNAIFTSSIALVTACLLTSGATAETIISCGGTFGWAYYYDTAKEGGGEWLEDSLSNGAIALVKNENTLDILTRDAVGMTSATAEGASVQLIQIMDPFVTVLVQYPRGATEVFTFDLLRRRVSWSQHKFGVMFDKAMTLVGNCN